MSEGQARQAWAHTSALLAMTANCHRDAKRHRAFRPDDFNPCRDRAERTDSIDVSTAEGRGAFKKAFSKWTEKK